MSQKQIKFEIVTPERTVLKEEITQVTVPTKQGEITVLPGHIPLVASLEPGVIEIVKKENDKDIMSVSGGFIEVLRDKIVILADTAERAEEIDLSRAEEAKRRAEKLLAERHTAGVDEARAEVALHRALTRLTIGEKIKRRKRGA